MMTPEQMDGTYAALVAADGDGDTEALAQICWRLYGELGETRARAGTLHARLAAAARAVSAPPVIGTRCGSSGPRAGGNPCPGCGAVGQAVACVFCGQPQDPGCGYGVEYALPSAGRPGRWRCTGCQAVAADDRQAAGAAP